MPALSNGISAAATPNGANVAITPDAADEQPSVRLLQPALTARKQAHPGVMKERWCWLTAFLMLLVWHWRTAHSAATSATPFTMPAPASVTKAVLKDIPAPTVPLSQMRIAFESQRDGQFNLYTMNADGAHVTRITNALPPEDYQHPAVSPDGKHIAFIRFNKTVNIYRMEADGSHVHALTPQTAVQQVRRSINHTPPCALD